MKMIKETVIENGIELEKVIEYEIEYTYFNSNPVRIIRLEEYYKDDKLHREDDKPAYTSYYYSGQVSIEKYYKDGKLHRDNDLPAEI